MVFLIVKILQVRTTWHILGDPGADSGGEGKSKWAGKNQMARLSLASTIYP